MEFFSDYKIHDSNKINNKIVLRCSEIVYKLDDDPPQPLLQCPVHIALCSAVVYVCVCVF